MLYLYFFFPLPFSRLSYLKFVYLLIYIVISSILFVCSIYLFNLLLILFTLYLIPNTVTSAFTSGITVPVQIFAKSINTTIVCFCYLNKSKRAICFINFKSGRKRS